MIAKLIISFSNMADATLSKFAESVIQSFTDNVNFPTTIPTLKDVNTDYNTYVSALAVSGRYFPKGNTILKNQAKAALITDLRQLAMYAMQQYPGDAAVLADTGFQLYKTPSPVGILPQATNLKVVTGPFKGSLKISVNKVPRALFYDYQVALMGTGSALDWVSYTDTPKAIIIQGLTSGAEYAVRVAGAATGTSRTWSIQTSIYVQ